MRIRTACLLALLALLGARPARAQTYTLAPPAIQQFFDTNGAPLALGKLCTYAAGTSTPATTYIDNAGTLGSNPILLDASGRPSNGAVYGIFLAQSSYKFVLLTAGSDLTCSTGTTVWTLDNITAVPGSSANVDIPGTAGETLTAGQAVYLSDGSGGKTAGRWYKADSTNTYSSTNPEVGIALAAATAGQTSTFRISGQVTGLTSLSTGAEYFVSAAGALTATAPTNRRHVGHADTTTSLVFSPNPPPANASAPILSCGRLTLTTGTPVTTADVTAATTIYLAPISGCNQYTIWNGTALITDTLAQTSVAVPATTSQLYDVFAFDNAGAINIEVLAWTNDTTRATAITVQNGFLAKSGDATRKYVGSVRTTTVSGQTEDSFAKRFVWNYYNRVPRPLQVVTSSTWTYSTATYRQANASTTNQLAFVVGVADGPLTAQVQTTASNSSGAGTNLAVAIGQDSTTAVATGCVVNAAESFVGNTSVTLTASLQVFPAVGYHFYAWLEISDANPTTTWGAAVTRAVSGISGVIQG